MLRDCCFPPSVLICAYRWLLFPAVQWGRVPVSTGFWTGGPKAYETWLREEYKAKRGALQQARREAGSAEEQWRIDAELQSLDAEYREQLAHRRGSLF
jgi:hypothetical protein